jgi:hypothetical protein
MHRPVRAIVSGTFFVAILIAAAYLAAFSRDGSRLPIHTAMLDIIRCSPPTHPDAWLRNTGFAPLSAARIHGREELVQRADIFDPSDCGRVITQTMSPAIAPANRARPG